MNSDDVISSLESLVSEGRAGACPEISWGDWSIMKTWSWRCQLSVLDSNDEDIDWVRGYGHTIAEAVEDALTKLQHYSIKR